MSQPHDPIQQASRRYHTRYSDASYKAIQRGVIMDLYGPADTLEWETQFDSRLSEEIPNRLMNTITDAASEICQWPGFEGGVIRLIYEIVLHPLSETTLILIVGYLHLFEDQGELISADLHVSVKVMRLAHKVEADLKEAACCASEFHSWQGRAAHDLLVAVTQLIRAADLLLKNDEPSYIQEKVRFASNRIASAQQEEKLRGVPGI